jgi:hypothetical protein
MFNHLLTNYLLILFFFRKNCSHLIWSVFVYGKYCLYIFCLNSNSSKSFGSPKPAVPNTMEKKTIGTTSIFIKFKNILPSGENKFLTAVLASVGTAGVPGVGLIMLEMA